MGGIGEGKMMSNLQSNRFHLRSDGGGKTISGERGGAVRGDKCGITILGSHGVG